MPNIENRKITTELQVDRCGLSNTLHGNMVQYGALDIPIKHLESRRENTYLENSRVILRVVTCITNVVAVGVGMNTREDPQPSNDSRPRWLATMVPCCHSLRNTLESHATSPRGRPHEHLGKIPPMEWHNWVCWLVRWYWNSGRVDKWKLDPVEFSNHHAYHLKTYVHIIYCKIKILYIYIYAH